MKTTMPTSTTLPFTVAKHRPRHQLPDNDHAMKKPPPSTLPPTAHPPIYPRKYFSVSPTFNHWNKLTCFDLHHHLRAEPGFQGQKLLFHLNHPIQFVRLVGVLVEIDTVAEGRYTLLTLDDGSGACAVVKIVRRKEAEREDGVQWPSNTEVDNVDVRVRVGAPLEVYLNGQVVQLGSVLKVKGTLDTFRSTRQLELKRLFLVPDTTAEAQAWSETARWKSEVLSQPWVLKPQQREAVDRNLVEEERKGREHERRRREWERKAEEKRRRRDEKSEGKRKKLEAFYDAGALRGSSVLPTPWE